MKNSIQKAEEILIELNDKKGFLTEDEIIDVCIELDLDLVEIDVMCERLLNKKMLFSDNITSVNDSDDIVDRSQYDYVSSGKRFCTAKRSYWANLYGSLGDSIEPVIHAGYV